MSEASSGARAEARLVGFYFFCRFEAQIGNLISSVAAVSFAAANRKILERIVAGKELRGITGNSPDPFGQFQPQSFNQL